MSILDLIKNNWVEWFKKLGNLVMSILVGLVIFWIALKMFIGSPEYFKDAKEKGKQIQLQVDSIKKQNDFITERLFSIELKQNSINESISENNDKIDKTNSEIYKLRKVYDQKISNIDNVSLSELDSILRDRYKRYYP